MHCHRREDSCVGVAIHVETRCRNSTKYVSTIGIPVETYRRPRRPMETSKQTKAMPEARDEGTGILDAHW